MACVSRCQMIFLTAAESFFSSAQSVVCGLLTLKTVCGKRGHSQLVCSDEE